MLRHLWMAPKSFGIKLRKYYIKNILKNSGCQWGFTLLWLSILAWIFPSKMRDMSSSSSEATVVLKDEAISRRSADK